MTDNQHDHQEQAVQGAVCREVDAAKRTYVPRVDVYEKDDSIVLLADMPGVDEQSVDVTLEKHVLTIKGTVDLKDSEDHHVYFAEYGVGDYERAFAIGEDVDREHISARMADGVLNVILPKREGARVKKITVTTM